LKNLVRILNYVVAALAASVVISIFYEGMVLRWFSFVPVFMIAADAAFIIATICNLMYFKKRKLLLALNILSAVLIIAALATKALGWEHPEIFGVVWYFYIFFYYYTMVIKQIWNQPLQEFSDVEGN